MTPAAIPERRGAPPGDGFWRKTWAMLVKEFIQLRRDRVSFAMIIMIPLMQLMLFGYAINTTPRNLPTAVLLQERSDCRPFDPRGARRTQDTSRSRICRTTRSRVRSAARLRHGSVRGRDPGQFRTRAASRRQAGDAGRCRCHRSGRLRLRARCARSVVQTALAHDRAVPDKAAMPFEIRTHARYNPAASTAAQYRARPGRHHPHHDHADLYGAIGHARDRARHDGKPAVDADHAGRDHARQDRALCYRRVRAGGTDHRHRRALFGVPILGSL